MGNQEQREYNLHFVFAVIPLQQYNGNKQTLFNYHELNSLQRYYFTCDYQRYVAASHTTRFKVRNYHDSNYFLNIRKKTKNKAIISQPLFNFLDVFQKDDDIFNWHVTNKDRGARLIVPGDIIKLGRTKLFFWRVLEDRLQDNQLERTISQQINQPFDPTIQQSEHQLFEFNSKQDYICRICFDPLKEQTHQIYCKCLGSIKHIHKKCLIDWIQRSVNETIFQNGSCLSWVYKCQICLSRYTIQPELFAPRLKSPSIYFYTISGNRLIIFSTKLKANITIGRHVHSDLVIKDISVSRDHCTLQYDNGKIYIQDSGSMFGTLLLMKAQFQCQNQQWIQHGQLLIKLNCQQQQSIGLNCCCSSRLNQQPFMQIQLQ